MRRASVSIPSNIAEGYARKTKNDNLHFQIMACGSALELETQLNLSIALNFTTKTKSQTNGRLIIGSNQNAE